MSVAGDRLGDQAQGAGERRRRRPGCGCATAISTRALPGATDWTRVLQAERACTGFAEREFTLERGQLGYQVVEMSGPVRDQP